MRITALLVLFINNHKSCAVNSMKQTALKSWLNKNAVPQGTRSKDLKFTSGINFFLGFCEDFFRNIIANTNGECRSNSKNSGYAFENWNWNRQLFTEFLKVKCGRRLLSPSRLCGFRTNPETILSSNPNQNQKGPKNVIPIAEIRQQWYIDGMLRPPLGFMTAT